MSFYTKIIYKSIGVYKVLVKLHKVSSQLNFIVHIKEA